MVDFDAPAEYNTGRGIRDISRSVHRLKRISLNSAVELGSIFSSRRDLVRAWGDQFNPHASAHDRKELREILRRGFSTCYLGVNHGILDRQLPEAHKKKIPQQPILVPIMTGGYKDGSIILKLLEQNLRHAFDFALVGSRREMEGERFATPTVSIAEDDMTLLKANTDKPLIMADDVWDTGGTAKNLAGIFSNMGFKKIYLFTLSWMGNPDPLFQRLYGSRDLELAIYTPKPQTGSIKIKMQKILQSMLRFPFPWNKNMAA